jgi:hypothetical protein
MENKGGYHQPFFCLAGFFGLPIGRGELSVPIFRTVGCAQRSSPYGCLRESGVNPAAWC